MLPTTLIPFKNIISKAVIKLDRNDSGLSHTKIEISFINNTVLYVNEVVVQESNYFKYSYQWQNPDNSLLIRWDNANHSTHKDIPTFPHHKHVSTNENVHPSSETTLQDVLQFISDTIIT